MADTRVGGERFAFDEDVRAEEVGRFTANGPSYASARTARIERPGAQIAVRSCEGDGIDGSLLRGCAKVYVPLDPEPSRAPYGFVFAIRAQVRGGRVMLLLIAYGERHPASGTRSVYERAHRRLHGRYPDQ